MRGDSAASNPHKIHANSSNGLGRERSRFGASLCGPFRRSLEWNAQCPRFFRCGTNAQNDRSDQPVIQDGQNTIGELELERLSFAVQLSELREDLKKGGINYMLKVHILSRRRSDMTHEQYVAHWQNVHAPLFASQPDVKRYVRRYVQCWITGDKPGGPNLGDTDGIVELWFDDIDSFNAFGNSPS